ncbi:Uncharacterised protein [Raoultella terrigena]|uniref:Uncharacterized protein n=1 Tax=Raoultella terrigena TaxID=577 RepID=A0A3P8J1E8_RAOTE|nr:Uncharacterised protein [Raoultella terrigena]
MPASHSPMPARSWIVRLAGVCWERKKLSLIVVVASVATIVLAALTPLLTRQAVNDALAGNPTRLPWLACGLLLIGLLILSATTCGADTRGALALGSAYPAGKGLRQYPETGWRRTGRPAHRAGDFTHQQRSAADA